MTKSLAAAHLDPSVRHDMLLLFDVTDGNPNGNPDAGNQPRVDIESGHGLVTDVCIKRKIRDTFALAAEGDPRYGIFVEAGHALNTRLDESYQATGLPLKSKTKITREQADTARAWLCDRYADIRLFGAVLSTGNTNALGQIRGPIQVGMARSIDPVTPTEHAITRVTQTRAADIDKGESTEMGSKWTVPYGLYAAEISYSANRGVQTGTDSRDFELLYRVLEMMFDHDRSAARGAMVTRKLVVFSHDNKFGNAPARKLYDRITITRPGADIDSVPRHFSDYKIEIDVEDLPAGVTVTEVIS
ncbi:type I-C CRISPR-associated protein Cas7/Csd2 [Nocardia camponoti]|uniref:Type I-C CRISPR-associated protein Cas7/Csd2 n=1 Tax=Nocardia camponoti TaxID=1616106 RepID=A0A917QGB3_9NOCA|nr:type I-C CRISPR-associated protein Cas7/Csd2 [Nocardia camponoti]GGK49207.1 type I-C CRISPR-associated protein Cas7/Csd2 [Nocardia camponoti]